MLEFKTVGPNKEGKYFSTYVRSKRELVVVSECRTKDQANKDVARLIIEQARREEAIQRERDLCGFARISNDLGAI